MSVLIVLSVTMVSVFAADAAVNKSKILTVTLKGFGTNTELCTLKKVYPEKEYSKMRVFSDSSTINRMEGQSKIMYWIKLQN